MSTIALARTTFGASTARVPAWIVETATYRAPEGADVDPEGEVDAVDFDRIMGEAETAARAIAAQWEPESPRRAWTTDAEAQESARERYERGLTELRAESALDPRAAQCIFADDATLTYGWRVGERVLWSRSWRAAPAEVRVETVR